MAQDVKSTSSKDTVLPTTSDITATQLLQNAMKHIRSGRLHQAKTELEDITRRYPNDAAPIHYSGLVAHYEGNNARAFQLLEKAIEMNHVVPFFHGNLGEVYRTTGRYDDALRAAAKR